MNVPRATLPEIQRKVVTACKAAMPAALQPLWDTMLHAPNVVYEDTVSALRAAYSDEGERMAAVLSWFGHGDGSCPVCWMLVGKLIFSFPEPVRRLVRVVEGATDGDLLNGACLFLNSHLEPRHALSAGVSRERLATLREEVRKLPVAARERLVDAWAERGGEPGDLLFLG